MNRAVEPSSNAESPKPVFWLGSTLETLRQMPARVRRTFGQALFDAQTGEKHPDAKPLKGFGGAGVLEVVETDDGNAYRAAYAVKFAGAVYVLHAFQKKAKHGIATPPEVLRTIKARLKIAEKHHAERRQVENQEAGDGR